MIVTFRYNYKYNYISTIVYFVGTVVFLVLGIVAKPMMLVLFTIGIVRTVTSWAGMKREIEAIIDDTHIIWGENKYKTNLEWKDIKCNTIHKKEYTELLIDTGYSSHKLFFFGSNKVVIDKCITSGKISVKT